MKTEEILKVLNRFSTLDERYQIKYIDPVDYSMVVNTIESIINSNLLLDFYMSLPNSNKDKSIAKELINKYLDSK